MTHNEMSVQSLPHKTSATDLKAFAKKIKNRYFNRFSGARLYDRLERLIAKTPEIKQLFPYDELAGHYVYEPARQTMDHPDIYINQVRYYRLYHFFKTHFSDVFLNEVKVADIGDTSGILLRAMGRKGLSVNINPEVVTYIQSKGIEAQQGDAENLELKDKAFDYSFCFQCLEHLNNPIKALGELSRVTRRKVFVSIPFVRSTVIYGKGHWENLLKEDANKSGWGEENPREVDCHKFEFSTDDFKKIISHADLTCVDHFPINYFSGLGEKRINEGSYFNFFILEPTGSSYHPAS